MKAAESEHVEDRVRIRKAKRRLILPLLLAGIIGAAWWWSYRSLERYLLAGYGGQVNEIVLMRGVFIAGSSSISVGAHDAFTVRRLAEPLESVTPSPGGGGAGFAPLSITPYDGQFAILEGDFGVDSNVIVPMAHIMKRDDQNELVSASILFPIWFFLIPVGLWSLWVAWKLQRVRRAAAAGHCLQCGYDLRASSDRCPECGTPLPASPA